MTTNTEEERLHSSDDSADSLQASTSCATGTNAEDSLHQEATGTEAEEQDLIDDHATAVRINDKAKELFRSGFDWKDPGLWPRFITNDRHTFFVENGPFQSIGHEYPKDDSDRRFSDDFYKRKLQNGENINRRWLVYSKTKDSVFCFSCKLFSDSNIKLTVDGKNDWRHLTHTLHKHELSVNHIDGIKMWLELEIRLKKDATIDKEMQQLINQEKEHWKNVLARIISIVQYLSQRNLAFRGSSDHLFEQNNGNFLGLIELLGKYDGVLQEHIRCIRSNEIHDHYLGKNIQNEIIQLMGKNVLDTILKSVRHAKYYSIILDCTPDISHQEQMTMVIRFINISMVSPAVVEHFVGFIPVDSSTGEDLANACLKKLEELGLKIENCRGQGYDNGANMRGYKSGVQKRVLELNPKAFFVPCGCHSINLMLGDMAKSSKVAMTLFGLLQQIYVLFSASTQRWGILKKHVKDLTVKPVYETRWECCIDSVKVVRFQVGAVYDALIDISEAANDVKARTEAAALAKEIKSFKFLVSLVIWYDLLLPINIVSKMMQSKTMNLDIALKCLEQTRSFLNMYKENGFESAQCSAKELAEELGMSAEEMIFPNATSLRRRKVKRLFDYEAQDEPMLDQKAKFRVEFFNVLLDQALSSLHERFDQLKQHPAYFGFLYNYEEIETISDDKLMAACCDLNSKVTDKSESDIDPADLCNELKMLSHLIPVGSNSMDSLKFIYENNLQHALPNVLIALRILLTIPVMVASGERSFSKLKLIKNYLRSTMTEDRLNSLALLSIERSTAESLNYLEVINDFSSMKARKVNF